ncbi:MAG: 3TM-type holin [Planctomycetota bacterium]|jgi:hypothetical protein
MPIPIIGDIIGAIVGTAGKVIDELHTSEEEKAAAKARLLEAELAAMTTALNYEQTVAQEKGATLRVEMQGNTLQRSWRPVTMLVFVFIIFNNYVLVPYVGAFGAEVPALDIPPGMWALLNVGIGGYIASRGLEKWQRIKSNGGNQ